MKSRWAGTWLAIVLNAVVAAAGCVVLAHLSRGGAPHIDPPPATDLHFLSESMLVDENAVARLDGTTWGRIVAVPQGSRTPVNPPGCALFLSQGDASQKGLAMRSSQGAAIGVELAISDQRVDLANLRDTCAYFSLRFAGHPIERAPGANVHRWVGRRGDQHADALRNHNWRGDGELGHRDDHRLSPRRSGHRGIHARPPRWALRRQARVDAARVVPSTAGPR